MATLQEDFELGLIQGKRTVYDLNISRVGVTAYLFRYKFTKDKHGDNTEIKFVSSDTIECIIKYPPDVPLFRNRAATGEAIVSSGVFLYDIMPIDVYFKFTDNVEKGDYLVHVIRDSLDNKDIIMLQVADVVGSFHTRIVQRKGIVAPYNGLLTDELTTKIDELLE